jgi:hypothetical protein
VRGGVLPSPRKQNIKLNIMHILCGERGKLAGSGDNIGFELQ